MPPKEPSKPQAGTSSTSTPTTNSPRNPKTFSNSLTQTLLTALQGACKDTPQNHTFTNKAILALPALSGKTQHDIFPAINELLKTQHLVLLRDPSSPSTSSTATPLYRLRYIRAVDALKGLDSTHLHIYSMIEGSGRHGVWSKFLTRTAELHQATFTKIIRTLESRKLVKQMRNVKNPSRKMYLLQELEPLQEATGGPWYTDGELDEALVETVSSIVVGWIEQRSWRVGPKSLLNVQKGEDWEAAFAPYVGAQKRPLLPHPPDYEDYPTAEWLTTQLDIRGVVEGKDIGKADVQMLLDVLEFDGRIERVGYKEEEEDDTGHDEEEAEEDELMGITHGHNRGAGGSVTADDRGIPTGQDGEEDPTSDAELPEDNISQSIEQDAADSEPEVDPNAPYQPGAERTAEPKTHRKRKRIPSSTPQPKGNKKGRKSTQPPQIDQQQDNLSTQPEANSTQPHLVPMYRSVRRPTTQDARLGPGSPFAETPCSRCPVFDLCQEGGPVNAKDCGYFEGWLRGDARSVGVVGEVNVGGGGGRLDY